MSDKLDMYTKNITQENIEKIGALFPHCVTETIDEQGRGRQLIDFECLKQELSEYIVSDVKERYQFTWPDKTESKLQSNRPINKTLRPYREESIEFSKTGNLYIEGDNLDVLKLLREAYLGKVKMIYIDPPYNTGDDFLYKDNFKMSVSEYQSVENLYDSEGNMLFRNADSNGRFHTDWLNMMYPRLRISRDLLSEDGVILVSIDDREVSNVRKIMDEIFGKQNFIAQFIWKKKAGGGSDSRYVAVDHEYVLVYAKDESVQDKWTMPMTEVQKSSYRLKDSNYDIYGPYKLKNLHQTGIDSNRPNLNYPITCPDGSELWPPTIWRWSKETFDKALSNDEVEFVQNRKGDWSVHSKMYLNKDGGEYEVKPRSILIDAGYTRDGKKDLIDIFGISIFDYPKPVKLIKLFLDIISRKDGDIVLDFFGGSSTTAHAVMESNYENAINRKFIMVQLPENLDYMSDVVRGHSKKTISDAVKLLDSIGKPRILTEIGKERIRRVGDKLSREGYQCNLIDDVRKGYDIGFRVLKIDSSNMKDIYYTPDKTFKHGLDELLDNVKEDRTPEDLLFQVMLELGVDLSSKIEEHSVDEKKIFSVDENYLIACFDVGVSENVVTEIAKKKPHYAVMRDYSMSNDNVAVNFEQIFKTYSPETIRKVI
ncbi:MAG: site-specific DNA-methyltransferase [Candidatus Methanomethylophilaceae archaeon]